ncbi:hypothetical protein BDA99DRAFT_8377 [Phascolomyces articulosus]|uniref:Uncharacterized protein n=1 Tax=Phascolomyces articulosus TaxID=60185 RepID=A0AAD5KRM6_9FUNG|nr:hypothetical protein BDA99DRAFT_8377 [Phascolomyces articulosus]
MRMYKHSNTKEIEDTFVHRYLADLLNVVFDMSDLVDSAWANKALNLDNSSLNEIQYKPDYLIYFFFKDDDQKTLFTAEVKPVSRNVGVVNDTVKLGYEMKLIMDVLIEVGVANPIVCGLIVKDAQCEGYIMDLKYEATYRLTRICQFKLPKSFQDLPLFVPAVEAMLQLRTFIESTALSMSEKQENKAKNLKISSKHLIPKEYRRMSFSKHQQTKAVRGKVTKNNNQSA